MRCNNTVLVVDDDPDVRDLLGEILWADGFVVHHAATAAEGLDKVRRLHPDVLLLDLGLGAVSGFDLLRELTGEAASIGIIVVSGRDEEADRVAGLELGADDYITKPFMRRELVARVRAVIRRSAARSDGQAPATLVFGPLAIDAAAQEATLDQRPVGLTAKEFQLLHFLASSPRRVYAREQILEHVWGSSEWRASGTVSEHVRRVRLKLAATGSAHDWITTLKGAGYRFEPEPTPKAAARGPLSAPGAVGPALIGP